MYEGDLRRKAETTKRGGPPSRVQGRPDRVALWAVFVAVAALIAGAVSAATANAAGSGGTSTEAECAETRFGKRALKLGDCGDDVKTLNWVLKAKRYANGVGLHEQFDDPTHGAVRKLQRRAGLSGTGVVNKKTRREVKSGMKSKVASWYGPGFYGGRTACGQRLKRKTIGIAHRRLPCGTKVVLNKGGRWLRTRVIDRGPFIKGRTWDLTRRASRALGMKWTERVRSSVVRGK